MGQSYISIFFLFSERKPVAIVATSLLRTHKLSTASIKNFFRNWQNVEAGTWVNNVLQFRGDIVVKMLRDMFHSCLMLNMQEVCQESCSISIFQSRWPEMFYLQFQIERKLTRCPVVSYGAIISILTHTVPIFLLLTHRVPLFPF